MSSARLAAQISLFALAALIHAARISLDLFPLRPGSSSSSDSRGNAATAPIPSSPAALLASIGFSLYLAAFALDISESRTPATATAAATATTGPNVLAAHRLLVYTALCALKASVASLCVWAMRLPLRVMWLVAGYLACSFLVVVAAHLALCRPWSAPSGTGYCPVKSEAAIYTALNVAGYLLVMATPLTSWPAVAHKPHVLCMQALGAALCALSITHAELTVARPPAAPSSVVPGVLIDVEIALAQITASLPALWSSLLLRCHRRRHHPASSLSASVGVVAAAATAGGAADRAKQLSPLPSQPATPLETSQVGMAMAMGIGIAFDPRHLGVLPDSIPGSIRSDISPPPSRRGTLGGPGSGPGGDGRGRVEDWQAESREALRDFSSLSYTYTSFSSREFAETDGEHDIVTPSSLELWEMDADRR